MNRKGMIGIVIAVPVLIVAGFVIYLLGQANELPGQTQPTRIPTVAAFSNLGGTAPAGTTVAASTPTTAPAAATSAPSAAATTASTAATPAPAATPVPTSASASTSSSAATAPAGSAAAKAPAGATNFSIVGDKSEAKVTVNEKLAALPAPSDAVLTTSAMQGQIILGADGKPVDGSKIQVDLRTLKSDKAQRDNYIQQNTLKDSPLAEYVITGVDGLTGPFKDGQQTTFKILGNMTIHGITKPVTFDAVATMQGDSLTGTAKTTFKFQDFGLAAPVLPILKADDNIKLDLNIAAAKKAG